MTKLVRVRTAAVVPAAFQGPGRLARSLQLLQDRLAGTLVFQSNIWKPAKNQLKKESGGKCAYCESPTDTVAHGDVEHFRPKSVYWWLGYCYDNYLYSCQICNQMFKKDNFPVHATAGAWAGPTMPNPASPAALSALAQVLTPDGVDIAVGHAEFLAATKAEKAGCVDPYVVDPDPLFKWVADDVLKEVEIRAASNTVASKRAFAAARDFYGLNREELKRWRWKTHSAFILLKDALETLETAGVNAPLQERIRDEIRDMMKVEAPYAGMVRYFVGTFGLSL